MDNSSSQNAPEGASGTWAKRYQKMFGVPPQKDASGKYKVRGLVVSRPGKTKWDHNKD